MNSRVLISCQNVGYSRPFDSEISTGEKWDIRKLSLELYAGDRACFHFQNEEQKEVLWRIFMQKLKPKTGSLMIHARTNIHTDDSFWVGTDKRLSLLENMKSRLFVTRPWFGGKRKNIETLMERLGLNGRIPHLPVQELSAVQATRFWVLMLVTAKTKVVLIDQLFSRLDEISLPFIQEWLENYAGILILFGKHPEYLKSVKNSQETPQRKVEPFFNTVISFSASGHANTLLPES